MSLEVQVVVQVQDTLDGERIYSCTRRETIVPARFMTSPDPEAIVPLLDAAVTRLADESRDVVRTQLEQGSDIVKEQFGGD